MRKYLIAALVAVLSIAVAAVAVAQTASTEPDVDVSLTPSKAGTKKKPKNSTLKLFVKNNRTDATVDTITVNVGKNVKLNGKGFKYCTAADAERPGQDAPARPARKAGKGTANAVVGPGRAPLKFTVDAYVGSKSSIIFYVQQVGGTVRKALTGKVSRASGKFGSKIVIKIDEDLQQPGPERVLVARRPADHDQGQEGQELPRQLHRLQEQEAQLRREVHLRPERDVPGHRLGQRHDHVGLQEVARRHSSKYAGDGPAPAGPSSFLDC